MNIISVKQLREDFQIVKKTISQGQSLLLIYRSQPLAEIRPLRKRRMELDLDKMERGEKNLQKVKKLAGGFHLGKGFTPQEKVTRELKRGLGEILSLPSLTLVGPSLNISAVEKFIPRGIYQGFDLNL